MRTHRFEPVSLLFGLVFAGIGLVVLQGDDLWNINWSWFWPVALTVTGLTLVLSVRPARRDPPQAARDTDIE